MIKLVWVSEITQAYCLAVVHSMHCRIEAVLKNREDTPNIEKLLVFCVLLCLYLNVVMVL